jgi:energy-coupling factor transport system substrate-specific component
MAERTSSVRPGIGSWTTLDIVIVAVIGVVFGFLNSPFGLIYQSFQAAFGPIGANIFGVFNISSCLAMFIVRKPGAALVNMLINGLVQMLSGNPAGAITLGWGLTQGLGAEAIFWAVRYQYFDWKVMFLAGAWANVFSNFWTYGVYGFGGQSIQILVAGTVIGFFTYGVLSGLVALAIGKALQTSGVLRSFASGQRERT